jgi:hypothetical protein
MSSSHYNREVVKLKVRGANAFRCHTLSYTPLLAFWRSMLSALSVSINMKITISYETSVPLSQFAWVTVTQAINFPTRILEARFESWPGYRLSWLSVVVICLSPIRIILVTLFPVGYRTASLPSFQTDHSLIFVLLDAILLQPELLIGRWTNHITGCFKKSSTTLKAYMTLFSGHIQFFQLT